MNAPTKSRRRKNAHFWRACRYLWPHRAKLIISITSAIFVGLSVAGSLAGSLPIFRLLTTGDTIQGWIYRQVAAYRLGAKLSSEAGDRLILDVDSKGPAANAGIPPQQSTEISDVAAPADAPPSPIPDVSPDDSSAKIYRAAHVYRNIAWADQSPITVTIYHNPLPIQLKPLKWHSRLLLQIVERLPIKPVQSMAIVFGILAFVAILGQAFRFFQEHNADKAAILAISDIRRRLYDRVLRVPMRFYGQERTSDVTSRLVNDSSVLQEGFKQVLGQSIQEPIKAAMAMGVAFWCSWRLTCFMVLFAPVMGILLKKFGKKMRRASRAAMESSSTMLGQIEATLNGIRVVKAAGAERFERHRYTKIMDSLIHQQVRMSFIDTIGAPILESLIMLMAGCVILFAAYMLFVSHTLESQDFFAVMASMAMVAESLRRFSKVNNALQKANASAARIFETLDLPIERDRAARLHTAAARKAAAADGQPIIPRKLPPLQSRIEFQDITFTYPNALTPAVDDVSLSIPRGQSIAVVGRNGSGKTSLLALLLRYYDPQSGRITIDGVDISRVTLASLRRQISIVTQDSVIFPGTIAQNIAYGNPLASPTHANSPARRALFEQMEDAARRAFAHDFITKKPAGYETFLGEMGGQLSGGEKQRLCIARAILRQSPILILDEATSQVDAESEHLIQQAIEQIMHERTTFVIAHRFSTILSADTIVVMERGRVVGQGRHDQLLRTCSVYGQLYERQLHGAVPDEILDSAAESQSPAENAVK